MNLEVRKFLSRIGKKGRKAAEQKHGKEAFKAWGKRGGRPKKLSTGLLAKPSG